MLSEMGEPFIITLPESVRVDVDIYLSKNNLKDIDI